VTHVLPAEWSAVQARLLTRVFSAHPPEDVAASTDLVGDGYLDSMSILMVLSMFDEELGEGIALQQARITDTASLGVIRGFYERLCTSGSGDASSAGSST
jgi:hypothetical protein